MAFVLFLLVGSFEGRASFITNTVTFSVDQAIPDNDLTGFADTHSPIFTVTNMDSIRVHLDISDGYNGDLFVYLFFTNQTQHSSAFTVLLNRPGRTASDDSGYADSGFHVTFDNSAPNGDIHNYQTVQNPQGGALSGLWQPDARNVHPDIALDTSARSADLSAFHNLDPNGTWTLFLADDSPLGQSILQSWQLEVVAVPEPTITILFAASMLGLFIIRRRR